MRIDRITLRIVRMSLITPFAASSHSTQELNHVLIRLDADGVVGWGECATTNDPYYLGETVETAWHIVKDFLAPAVLGKSWTTIDELLALFGPVKGNTFARAGVEMAAWDLLGRATNRSVADMLGGTRKEILSGVSLGIEKDQSRLHDIITKHLAEGYRRVKLKIAKGADVRVLAGVREKFPDVPLMADANSAYTLADTEHLKQLDPFRLLMIEQPLAWNDIVDHATLQKSLTTPVCLDESIRTADDARHAIALESCRIINLKVARLGGLVEAKRVHDMCHAVGMPLWVGGMHDYGIGRAANVALASLPGITIPGDISGCDKYFVEDIIDPPILADRGAIAVLREPGLGVHVDEDRVRKRTVRELVL
jgi:O-succinylbenzoate synthase